MSTQKNKNVNLQALENQVNDLIQTVSKLQTENSALKNQHQSLVGERAQLIQKTEMARNRIESMITRLKAMEND